MSHGNRVYKFLSLFFRYKGIVFTAGTLIFSVFVMYALFKEPVYQARSTILLKLGKEYLAQPETGDDSLSSSLVHPDALIASELQILSSRDLRKKVVAEVKPERIYPDLLDAGTADRQQAATDRLDKSLKTAKIKNSNVVEISFEHRDPLVAAHVVNTLVSLYREKHLQVFRVPQSDFLERQLKKYAHDLEESQRALQTFNDKHDIYSLAEQRRVVLAQKSDMEAAYNSNENRITEMKGKISTLRRQLSNILTSDNSYNLPQANGKLQDAQNKLLDLQREQQQLAGKYRPENQLVINNKSQITLVKRFISDIEHGDKDSAKTGNRIYLELYREMLLSEATESSLVAKGAVMKNQLVQIDDVLANLNRNEQRLEELQRGKLTNEKNFERYFELLEESRVLDRMNEQSLANISVVQVATIPSMPVSSSRAGIVLLGFLCGICSGLGCALALHKIDGTVSTPQEVEDRLQLAVIVSIPYIKERAAENRSLPTQRLNPSAAPVEWTA